MVENPFAPQKIDNIADSEHRRFRKSTCVFSRLFFVKMALRRGLSHTNNETHSLLDVVGKILPIRRSGRVESSGTPTQQELVPNWALFPKFEEEV